MIDQGFEIPRRRLNFPSLGRALLFSFALHAMILAGVGVRLLALTVDLPLRPLHAILARPAATAVAGGQHIPVARASTERGDRQRVPPDRLRRPRADSSGGEVAGVPGVAPNGQGAGGDNEHAQRSSPFTTSSPAATEVLEDNASVDGLRQYRLALAREARRSKRYPPVARERGWEGRVEVTVVVGAATGPAVSLGRSSGIAVLDEQAVAMITQAVVTAALPESLAGRSFRLSVPVAFSLND